MRRKLQGLIDKYAHVPKKPAYIYRGGEIGRPAPDLFGETIAASLSCVEEP